LLAQDGAEAVAVASDAADLTGIVMDVNMPKMDGIVAMEAIRLRHPDVPVVLITGADGVRLKSRVAGADRVTILQKPFTFDGLIGAVTELFYGRSS
jgi:CheY-like chemotaxis protein